MWLPLSCPTLGTHPATQACTLTRNQTSDLLVGRLVLNPFSHTSQGSTKIFIRHLKLNMSKTELIFPLKPDLSVVPPPISGMNLYPSGCLGKNCGFFYNYSFLHIAYSTQLSVPKIFMPTILPSMNSKLKVQLH